MLDILRSQSNGNGSAINGRGQARHRHRLSVEQRIERAANLASGVQHLHPSIKDSAALYAVLPLQVSECLKARAQREVEWQAAEEAEAANVAADRIVSEWRLSSLEAREAAFRIIGAAEIWDTLARVVA
jgi:hypothetical protein